MWSASRSLVRRRREATVLLDSLVAPQRSQLLQPPASRFLSNQLPRMDYYGQGSAGGKDKRPPSSSSLPPKLEKLTQPSSTAAATPLPKRHSRKEAPPVCKEDWTTWNESVDKFVKTPVGHLYTYEHFSAQPFPPPTGEGREIAWNVSHTTVQQVEYWMRGYAARIPGSISWKEEQRAILVAANDDEYVDLLEHVPMPALNVTEAVKVLQQMEALVERLNAEGDAYMHVRADRCNELHQNALKERHLKSEQEIVDSLYSGKEDEVEEDDNEKSEGASDDVGTLDLNTTSMFDIDQQVDPNAEDTPKPLHDQLQGELGEHILGSKAAIVQAEAEAEEGKGGDDEDDDERLDPVQRQHKLYCQQFASPGPTMTMFQIWLDALAVVAPQARPDTELAELCWPMKVEQVFARMYLRHLLDGGDLKNQCEFTVANLVGFNAVIRACSHLPKPAPNAAPDTELRDAALLVGFSVFDALCHSKHVSWNAATFRNMLKLVDLFFAPATDMKGNVSVALFAQAQRERMVNESVLRQFLACHEPSNTPNHEDYLDRENLRPNADGSLDIPEKWSDKHMKARWHPADDTY